MRGPSARALPAGARRRDLTRTCALQVLREGVHLRNPFRYRFEEWVPAPQAPPAPAVGALAPIAEEAPAAAPEPAAAPAPAQDVGQRRRRESDGDARRTRARATPPPDAVPPAPTGAAAAVVAQALARPRRAIQAPRRFADEFQAPQASQQVAVVSAPAPPAAAPAAAPPAPVEKPLPPLPTFEPRVVAPLVGDTLADAVLRISNDCSCTICFELYVSPCSLACSHTFCGPCITPWVRSGKTCPVCRVRSLRPAPARPLEDVICAIVEPTLSEEAMANRQQRKLEWQTMQRQNAEADREAGRRRAAAFGHAPELLGGTPEARLNPMARLLHRDTQRLQEEVRNLVQLFNAGNTVVRAPVRLQPMLEAEARAGDQSLVWRVENVQSNRCICNTCFNRIELGALRVVREKPLAPFDAAAGIQPVRDFSHLACCVLRCPLEQLQGLAELSEADRRAVELRAAAVDAELAAELAATAAAVRSVAAGAPAAPQA